MDTAVWIAVFLPLFLMLFTWYADDRHRRILAVRRRGRDTMTNELLKKYLGSRCVVSTGTFGSTVTGVISAVEENWIEVTTKKGPRLMNADYVTNIEQTGEKR